MFGLTRAPEFPLAGLRWLNTDHPLTLDELRGKIVILDFWTFCCINCMHVLPTLKRIEDAFADTVQVIGVHSPKFAAERDFDNVAAAVRRYDIAHPVVHDPAMKIWQSYAVRAWPTLTLISPDGYVIGQVSGEPDGDRLSAGLETMLKDFSERGEIRADILQGVGPSPAPAPHQLLFPGKIKPLADPPPTFPQARWVVADSGHHQIVLFDDAGCELHRWGDGQQGRKDSHGAEDPASFNNPQGLCADPEGLWIADTGNHLLRHIDFATDRVTTIAGTGERGLPLPSDVPCAARSIALASPWDVEWCAATKDRPAQLWLANAGTHQLALFEPTSPVSLHAVVGSSGENLQDGSAENSLLAQPSGLAIDTERAMVWFADSETSAIRGVSMTAPHQVTTLIGQGLFDFGHVDGSFPDALLQHPLGLAVAAKTNPAEELEPEPDLIVADSYNAALRHLHMTRQTVTTESLGHCLDAVCLPLGEPAGLWADGTGRILVSDTNNHRIVEVLADQNGYRTWNKPPSGAS